MATCFDGLVSNVFPLDCRYVMQRCHSRQMTSWACWSTFTTPKHKAAAMIPRRGCNPCRAMAWMTGKTGRTTSSLTNASWSTGPATCTIVSHVASVWAAWYITRLLVKSTAKGVVFSFLVFSHVASSWRGLITKGFTSQPVILCCDMTQQLAQLCLPKCLGSKANSRKDAQVVKKGSVSCINVGLGLPCLVLSMVSFSSDL